MSNTTPEPCVFCQILAGTMPASMVYQDQLVMVFPSIKPLNPGHLLVVPKQHMASVAQLDDATVAHMMVIANQMNRALRVSGLECQGVNYHLSDGLAAGQAVFHVHLHVYPRFEGDPIGIYPDHAIALASELERVASQIKSCL